MELGETRAASTASGGSALTTTASVIQFWPWTQHLAITPRNMAGASVVKIAFNPWLYVLKTIDSLASEPFDYSEYAQDNSTGTDVDLSSLDTVANGDWVLLGSHEPFRGVQVDVDGANATGSVTVTMSYWNGSAWTDTSDTDGTSGSTHLDQDGAITWTVPTAWQRATMKEIADATGLAITSHKFAGRDEALYWIRWEVDLAVDAAVTLNSVCALNRSTNYAELASGQATERYIHMGPGGYGCIEALTDAGTANLVVNCSMLKGGRFK